MITLRPADLAREHGISTQAVRNYERSGFIPSAERTPSGYRNYTEVHAAALRAYLSLVPAYGYAAAGRIMNALHDGTPGGALDAALEIVDRGHNRLLRDRETLASVRTAVGDLTAESGAAPDRAAAPGPGPDPRTAPSPLTIGQLSRRLGVTTATVRKWEAAGILAPERDPATGYRVFGAADIRDAELAHLLRRGGYLLDRISAVVQQVRTAGGTDELLGSLADWQRKLTARGLAMLDAAAVLSEYLALLGRSPAPGPPAAPPPTP